MVRRRAGPRVTRRPRRPPPTLGVHRRPPPTPTLIPLPPPTLCVHRWQGTGLRKHYTVINAMIVVNNDKCVGEHTLHQDRKENEVRLGNRAGQRQGRAAPGQGRVQGQGACAQGACARITVRMGDVPTFCKPPRYATQKAYISEGGLRMIFDLSGRPFKFREGTAVVQANGPLVAMNGDAAGWRGLYPPAEGEKPGWFHGREGAGVSIVLDVVPSQRGGGSEVDGGLGAITTTNLSKWFNRPHRRG
jgi:hypothetical protein